jgi:hypothetical protein
MQFLNEDKRIWDKLTDEEKGKLLVAFYEGKAVQEWCEDEGNGEYDWYGWYDDCLHPEWADGIWRIKPETVKEVHWCNDYEHGPNGWWHKSRENADSKSGPARIAVIRREIVDGVVSYYKEDV